MSTPIDILKQYWGYPSFRPLQEDIINEVLSGKDTLALLPTGGGKSICFQVPALCKEGICIVISPLIALMKDQVYQLNQRGIPAEAIHTGMSKRLIDTLLDNCIYGNIKFLYVSPERLKTDIFIERFKKMNVNLIAVDEAHCISQWGYDFRPPYLEIAAIRDHHPKVPILALTATATPEVVEDIQEKLAFQENHLMQKSFHRKNLSYSVLYEDAKYTKLTEILQKVKGSAIVYVRSRRRTKEIADYLRQCKISADYYHAGLSNEQRSDKQEKWIKDKIRVIVSTNAFGMGIDKANVRVVVHMDLPESPEAYFQEAGRAGRDEKNAYAVLLFNLADKLAAQDQLENTMPAIKDIKQVYKALGNYFQLAIGAQPANQLAFDLNAFCKQYDFVAVKTYNALKFLEQEELIFMSEGVHRSSRIMLTAGKEALYKFMVENKSFEPLLKSMLRTYAGVWDGLVKINEKIIAKNLQTSVEKIEKALFYLDKVAILRYEKMMDKPFIQYTAPRYDVVHLPLRKDFIEKRIAVFKAKLEAMIHYASTKEHCRSNLLLAYFGEERNERCGICDFCLGRNKLDLNELEYKELMNQTEKVLKGNAHSLPFLMEEIPFKNKDKLSHFIQWLVSYDFIIKVSENKYTWNERK